MTTALLQRLPLAHAFAPTAAPHRPAVRSALRILVVTNLYPPHSIGGYEQRCRQIVEELEARGHTVRVLTSTHGLDAAADDGRIARRLRIHGFFGHPWRPIPRLFGLERQNHAALCAELAAFAPDVVHVWNLGGLSKATCLTLQQWGGPVVYDVSDHWIARSLRADVWQRWWNGDTGGPVAAHLRTLAGALGLHHLIRRLAPFAGWARFRFENIYFCSQALRDTTAEAGWPVGHGAVIPCPVDTERFRPRPRRQDCTRLLFVGRLHPDKDPLTAIRALARLHAAGETGFQLEICGHGDAEYLRTLRAEVVAANLVDAVTFTSATAVEMPAVYARNDVLLFTSAWPEPFALTPLEAMATGQPVIGTTTGGSAELFRDGENALTFPAAGPEALADRVQALAGSWALRERLAETGRREVAEKYALPAITGAIEQELRDAIRRHER